MKYDENQAKASILNQYFSSVFTKDGNLQPPPDMGSSPYPEMSNIEINCEGIAGLINELNPMKLISYIATGQITKTFGC